MNWAGFFIRISGTPELSPLRIAHRAATHRPPPLAHYRFSRERKQIDSLRAATRAGNSCINDVVVHYFSTHLPFGGVGNSGLGKAHGEFGFLAFSNQRGESEPRLPFRPVTLTYPPYTNRVRKVIELMLNWLA